MKQGESFGVFDRGGAIHAEGLGELGLFHQGTRFLSAFEISIDDQSPLLLSSTVRRDNALIVDLTNPDVPGREMLRDTVHLFATSFLWEGAWYARLRLRNYSQKGIDLHLAIRFGADYADIFEVRGTPRQRRGQKLEPKVEGDTAVLGYAGLDGKTRRTRLTFSPAPTELTDSLATFALHLAARGERTIDLTVAFELGGETPRTAGFVKAMERSAATLEARRAGTASVHTSNERFDDWIDRSAADLQMMATETRHGLYPFAGVPWYSTVFGRDGILTAFQCLWCDPGLARGVLGFLAANQAREVEPEKDAEPGKILHEMRKGEMANLGEVPFGCYYGTVDATPLFVMLAGAYWRRTGDRAFLESIWPNVERALEWIDRYGDLDGDGFVEYSRRSANGLTSQGWKDSFDSIFHRDGRLAEGAIALCEVQGYVYAARRAAAMLARLFSQDDHAQHLERQAEELREKFERDFWCEEISTYALALDGEKRPCAVRASNAGHSLLTGIASRPRAWRVAHTLLNESSFSGWGVRTLDANEVRYNPMSYHNGSVWPHDNSLIAYGMSRYGRKDGAVKVLTGLFEATQHFDLQRMPELFCGFRQRPHEGPTLYPVACAPQSWAAGAVFLLVQACLGLDVDAPSGKICLDRPELPACIDRLALDNLRVGDASVDLVFERYGKDVGVHLGRREGEVEVVVVK